MPPYPGFDQRYIVPKPPFQLADPRAGRAQVEAKKNLTFTPPGTAIHAGPVVTPPQAALSVGGFSQPHGPGTAILKSDGTAFSPQEWEARSNPPPDSGGGGGDGGGGGSTTTTAPTTTTDALPTPPGVYPEDRLVGIDGGGVSHFESGKIGVPGFGDFWQDPELGPGSAIYDLYSGEAIHPDYFNAPQVIGRIRSSGFGGSGIQAQFPAIAPGLGVGPTPGGVVTPPGSGITNPTEPSLSVGQASGRFLELSDAGLATLPEGLRNQAASFLVGQGYEPQGNVGRYGENTFLRPGGEGQFQFLQDQFDQIEDPDIRAWLLWYFNRRGYVPGTFPYPLAAAADTSADNSNSASSTTP